jgi:hypothetical protein
VREGDCMCVIRAEGSGMPSRATELAVSNTVRVLSMGHDTLYIRAYRSDAAPLAYRAYVTCGIPLHHWIEA